MNREITKRPAPTALAVAVAALATGTVTQAQPTGVDNTQGALEVITVTAERQERSSQDVPITMAAFDSDALREADFATTADLAKQVPGLQIKTSFSASNPTIFLRGVGINDFNPANSGAVGVAVDDLFYNSTTGQLFQMFDLERVEVLKGPQGTLYGRNTTGGMVNIHTAQPSFATEGFVTATYGRYNQQDFEGAVSLPVSDTVAIRLSGISNRRDGVRDIVYPDGSRDEKNDVDFQAARFQLLFEPSDSLSILAKLEQASSSTTARSYESQGLINFATGELGTEDYSRVCGGRGAAICGDVFGYVDDPDPYSGAENLVNTPEDVDSFSANLRIEWDLGIGLLTSVTGYLDTDRETIIEVDASPNRIIEEYIDDGSEQFSQELRFNRDFGDRTKGIFGAFYLTDEVSGEDYFELLGGLNPTPGEPFFDLVNFAARIDRAYTQDMETYAVFAQFDHMLTNELTVSLGARFTWEERELTHASFAGPVDAVPLSERAPVFFPLLTEDAFGDDSVSFEEPTYRLALNYRPSDHFMLFGSLSRGFKSGGFNTGASTDPVEAAIVEPEEVIAYEAGVKSDWLDRRLRLNASVFLYDYSDLQVFGLAQGGVPTQTLFNAEEAEIKGLDLEIQALPMRGLTLTLSASYLDAEYTDFVTPIGQDFSGNQMVAAPEWSLFTSARYETEPFANGARIAASINATYTDDLFFDTSNTDRLGQESYWLTNARAALLSPGERWEVSLYGKNLTDEEYVVDAFDVSDFGLDELVYGLPRTFGVSVHYNFGAQ